MIRRTIFNVSIDVYCKMSTNRMKAETSSRYVSFKYNIRSDNTNDSYEHTKKGTLS